MDIAPPTGATLGSWQLDAMRRIALVVAGASGPGLFDSLVAEVAGALPAAAAMVAVFADDSQATLRVLAMHADGRSQPGFDYPVAGSPCAKVVGRDYRFLASGVRAQVDPHSPFALAGFDAYAAFPLNDSQGRPLGVLAALDRVPIAFGDAEHAEVVLKVVAGRLAAELERHQAMEDLRRTAVAVSSARPESVFADLAAALAAILHVDCAHIGHHRADDPGHLTTLALHRDGELLPSLRYALATSPCSMVLGCGFQAIERDVAQHFPDDPDLLVKSPESYAGHPLVARDGTPLGVIAIGSRRPLMHAERVEAVLRIFAVRAAAEVERLAGLDALRRSEASYRGIFEAAPDSIFVHDWETFAFRDLNRTAEETLGYTREDLLTIAPTRLMSGDPPYDMEHALAHLRLAKLGRCAPFEWQARRKDGHLQWQEVHLKPVEIDGAPQILAFTRDITERKAAEEQLRAREAQYRAIFDASADALMLWNSQLVRVDVNPAHRRIFGFAREDVVGRAFEGLPYPDEFARPRLEMVRRALDGEASRVEITALRKDGTHILTELRTIPFTHGGEPHALQIARDITERKAAEERLRLSEQQYRAIFNASVDALTLWDSSVRRVDINSSYERLYGWSRDDVIGKGYDELPFGEEYCAPRRALVQRALAGEACSAELVSIRKDGQRILTEIHAVPFSHRGEPHVLVIGRDITERRAAEAERARLEEQLRQAQKMEAIGQLTGGIAHDFNNILTSVLGYIALAQERAHLLPDQRLLRQLSQAQRAGERARDLVAQMLAFARRRPGRRQVLAPQQLLLDTVDLLRPTLPSSVLLEVAEAVPTVPAVEVDAVQMGQVLMNLLINARDAVAGVGHVRVGLRATGAAWQCAACAATVRTGAWVEISVEDDGCGIAPDALRRIFDPFFSTKPAGHGTGMGLAMVHGIVHDHGGHVVVETAPGAGAVFKVLLPAVTDAPTVPEAVQSAPGPATAVLSGTVLVVEDDAQVGSYLAEQLGAWGLEVVLRADSREALRWLHDDAKAVHLVITDMTMPHISGLGLAAQARQLRPDLPVLLISADLAAADARALAASGVRARLPKPLDAAALRHVVTEALATRS